MPKNLYSAASSFQTELTRSHYDRTRFARPVIFRVWQFGPVKSDRLPLFVRSRETGSSERVYWAQLLKQLAALSTQLRLAELAELLEELELGARTRGAGTFRER